MAVSSNPTRTFSIKDLLNVRQFLHRGPWDLSPDGKLLAVALTEGRRREPLGDGKGQTVSGVNLEANGAYTLLIDTGTGEVIEPFPDAKMSWGFRWAPDGKILAAFVVMPDLPACVAVWDQQTHDIRLFPEAVVRSCFPFDVAQWTGDSRRIMARLAPIESTDVSGDPDVLVRSFDPDDSDSDPTKRFHPQADRDACVGIIDSLSGTVARFASDFEFGIPRLAPDGHAVALLNRVTSPVGSSSYIYDLVVVPFDGNGQFTLAAGIRVNSYACRLSWSPDSGRLCYVTGAGSEQHCLNVTETRGSTDSRLTTPIGSKINPHRTPWWTTGGDRLVWLQDGELYQLSFAEGTARRLTAEPTDLRINAVVQHYTEPTLGTDDEGNVLAHASRPGGDSEILRIHSVTGATETVCQAGRAVANGFNAVASQDGVFMRGQLEGDEMVYGCSIEGGEWQALLQLNPWRAKVASPSRHIVEFTDINGRQQEAAVFLPPGIAPGDRPAMIVSVYPEKKNSDRTVPGTDVYELEAELLTGAGYAAMYPDAIMGNSDPVAQIAGVTLPAVERAIEGGYAERNKIGIIGHSYGGYSVVSLLTQTELFRAGVSTAAWGINMTSTYVADTNAMRWCEFSQACNEGSPWEKRDRYIENSPFFLLDRVNTPLLIVCGSKDEPAAMSARETFLALRRLRKRVEMREYRREQHVMTWSAGDTKDYYDSVLRWFGQYLSPR